MGYEQIAINGAKAIESGKSVLSRWCTALGKTHSVETFAPALKKSEGIGLKYIPKSIGDTVQIDKIKVLKERLNNVLQSEYCSTPNFMSLIPKGATEEETTLILKELFEESKFFSRISNGETLYGKNFDWAKKMYDAQIKASNLILEEKSFKDILDFIAKKYSGAEWKEIKGTYGETRNDVSIYRGNLPNIIFGGKTWGPTTGYGGRGNGKNCCYVEYTKRLDSVANRRKTPFESFTLTHTSPSDCMMLHPSNSQTARNMEIISEKYKIYQSIVKEYKKTGTLNAEQERQAHSIIAEIYYLIANTMPFKRGSNGINDVLMRSQYSALGINMPHIKKGVSPDLEAFCFELNEYKKNWKAFFEGGGEIKPVIYESVEVTRLQPINSQSIEATEEYVKEGLMRADFKDKVEKATSIEECRELMKLATNMLEYAYASIRIPK